MIFSPIIIGTMRWGSWGANHSKKILQQLIESALSENLTTFDHADIYGDYTTEKLFGVSFSEMQIRREKVQFISKCGIEMPCKNRNFTAKSYNYSREHIINSVEQSLANLRTDYLDLLLLHRPSPLMNPHEIADTFDFLREQKKVRHFGVSNFSPSQFELLNSCFPLITNQVEISLNHTEAFWNGTLDQMMMKNLQPMAWSVMGNYFSEDTEQNRRIKTVMQEMCRKYGAEENQLMLAFLLRHPANILPVIGTSRAEIIKTLKGATDITIENSDWFRLLEASAGKPVP
ncbi:aldo/keto reductase [Kaistella palustris]|uniref:aldo/keto reductase n=1 Tax=Kaistella palustris TaxID=493376 RepID=UPI00040E1AEB|nr:aldo/keto reductase [Kaistella palustris]